jgi:hypothetical protein
VIAPAVQDADDLDLIDLTLVGVGAGFQRDEVGPFDSMRTDRRMSGASPPESWKVPKRICSGFDGRI